MNTNQIVELTDEKVKWYNEYLTEHDLLEIGVPHLTEWTKFRRWQAYNLSMYALGEEPPYGPTKDFRFIV